MGDCFTCVFAGQCRRQNTEFADSCQQRVATEVAEAEAPQKVALTMLGTARTVVVGMVAVALSAIGAD